MPMRGSIGKSVGEDCENQGLKFCPLPVETLGGWHPKATQVIIKLAKQLARHTGGLESEAVGHLFGRLGVLLMKSNAALLLSRSPDSCPEEVDGVVDS